MKNKLYFDTFIFDFDGVIIDTEKLRFEIIKREFIKLNINLSSNFFKNLIGQKTRHFFNKYFPNIDNNIVEKIIHNRDNIILKEKIPLFHGLKDLLTYLKNTNKKIAITTGSKQNIVNKVLIDNNIKHYFDILITGDKFKTSKPDPECYKITLSKLNSNPKTTIVLEDSLNGLRAAKQCGCILFALSTYLDFDILKQETDYVFKTHHQILSFLKTSIN